MLQRVVVGADREELMASGPRGGNSTGRSRRLTTARGSQYTNK